MIVSGWTFCAAAVGVAVGYVVGGQTLSLFVDIDRVDPARYISMFYSVFFLHYVALFFYCFFLFFFSVFFFMIEYTLSLKKHQPFLNQ